MVNGLYPERFSAGEVERLRVLDARDSPATEAALRAALYEHRWASSQRSQLRRLRRRADAPVITLPFLFEREIGAPQLERLSRELERRL